MIRWWGNNYSKILFLIEILEWLLGIRIVGWVDVGIEILDVF